MKTLAFPASRVRFAGLLAVAAFLAACSSGGDGGGSSGGTPPPSGLSYSASPALVRGTAMTALNPTVSGSVTGYSIAPALPAGLAIASTTGVISGTPTVVAAQTNYTVTASNAGGSTTATVSITVNDVPPDISYASATQLFTTGVPAELLPANAGGAAVSWSINGTLPAGLAFTTTDGGIRGTPTTASANAAFVVSATNSGGTDTFNLTIGVESGVLLDLGHTNSIDDLSYDGTRLLSRDNFGHWVLWNPMTGANLAQGDTPCQINACRWVTRLAGPTVAIRQANSVELRNSSDGALLADITIQNPTLAKWELSADGSYLTAVDQVGVRVWSRTGALLFTRAGDYRGAQPFAAAGEVRIATGPAGATVIEKIAVPAGTSTTTPVFLGNFNAWFLDGERFLTNANTSFWVFSHAAVQQDFRTFPNIAGIRGSGDRLWQKSTGNLAVYAVGGAATPIASYTFNSNAFIDDSNPVVSVNEFGTFQLIDVRTGSVRTHTARDYACCQVAALNVDDWYVGGGTGLLVDGTTYTGTLRHLTLGRPYSIAGGGNRAAVSVAQGQIYYFDVTTGVLEGQLDERSVKVQLSANGGTLATMTSEPLTLTGKSVAVYSLPSETLVNRWDYPGALPVPQDISLSASGLVIAQTLNINGTDRSHFATATTGGPQLWTYSSTIASSAGPVHLSPDGTHIAFKTGPFSGNVGTNLYTNGVAVSAVPGASDAWLDNGRVLVSQYTGGVQFTFSGNVIASPTGQILATSPAPDVNNARVVSPDRVYGTRGVEHGIWSLSTGNLEWTGARPLSTLGIPGAIAGGRVIYLSGATIRAERY